MKSGIYTITNKLDGKVYVGCTVNFYDRFRLHKKRLRLGTHENTYLQNVYNKYGDIFEFEVLEECEAHLLSAMEHYWVTLLNTRDRSKGYNLRKTHPYNRIIVSEETKKKLSDYNKSIGRIPPSRKGKVLSEETKLRISESQKRRHACKQI